MAANTHQRWMLVVEDNQDDEDLATRVFRKAGFLQEVVIARDGDEAIEALKREEPPALVLLDLKLPRLSGVDVLTTIREDERLKTVPVVVLTSSDEKTDVAACYGLGCNAFVRKPVDYHEYVRDVGATLDFWLRINRPPPVAELTPA